MALFNCPDCGHEVSDQATVCPHCGCPLEKEQKRLLDYALVLYAADYNDPNMLERLAKAADCSQEAAESLRQNTPSVLRRGLEFEQCVRLISSFSPRTQLGIIRDADADTPAEAESIPYRLTPAEKPHKPLTFWSVVGAILTAFLIWTLAIWVFAWMFSLGLRYY